MQLMRRPPVLLSAILFLSWSAVEADENTPQASRANVLVVVCDDLNTHVTTSGYRPILTPALERLAAGGMIFRRAYCQYPVCGPSRASFLSGLYPETTRVFDNKKDDIRRTRPAAVSLPELFKRNGYWTGGVGKVFHGGHDHGDRAWHEYHKFENDSNPVIEPVRTAFEAEFGSIDKPENRRRWRAKLKEIGRAASGQTPPGYGPTDMTDAGHKDGKNVRRIAEWLDSKAFGNRPFFLACGIHKPHVPFWAPRKYFDMYPKDELVFELSPADDWDDIPPLAMYRRFKAFGFQIGVENDSLRRDYTQAYHACVSFIDAQINLLFDALERNGHWDDTIVVLTSDHGYHLGEHFMWGKVTLFEECARVPLLVRVPGRTQSGSSTDGLVELVDLFPTLAELCDVSMPPGVQGRSFAQLIEDPAASGKPVAYTVVNRGEVLGRSIRTTHWRYAEWGNADGCELYNLETDPNEYTNLALKPEFGDQLKTMRRFLAEARARATQ